MFFLSGVQFLFFFLADFCLQCFSFFCEGFISFCNSLFARFLCKFVFSKWFDFQISDVFGFFQKCFVLFCFRVFFSKVFFFKKKTFFEGFFFSEVFFFSKVFRFFSKVSCLFA